MITLNDPLRSIVASRQRRHGFVSKLRVRFLEVTRLFAPHGLRCTFSEVEPLFWDRHAAFDLALAAIKQREWALAERELTNGNGHRALNDARCLNLLGVVFESTGRRGLARHCYLRAIRADRLLQAPRTNIKRYHELTTLGRTQFVVCLGDEKGVQL